MQDQGEMGSGASKTVTKQLYIQANDHHFTVRFGLDHKIDFFEEVLDLCPN